MGERLESWKEIAAYLDREVRTAQRWAHERGLPVYRLPGGDRPRVFSLKTEIDAWLRGGQETPRGDGVSIAVLPFANLSGRIRDQYFGDGLADDVINALVRIPGLRVTARTSSFAVAARNEDVRRIGARLGAAWLLEGSLRRDRQRVRVSAQLVSTTTGYHAWSESYDRKITDIFAIQDDIAGSIARALKVTLAALAPATQPSDDPGAHDLWMKGRSISQMLTPEAFVQARKYYEAAIARDPRFARPYFGLADVLFHGAQFGLTPASEALPRAREALARSLELDGGFGEAQALLGVFRGILDYDWQGSEAAFRRARELSPGSALVLTDHAWYHLVPRMQLTQALDETEEAVTLDPLSPLVLGRLGLVRVAARQYSGAVEACRAAVKLAPGIWWLRWFYGTALLMDGRVAEALSQSRKAYDQIHQPIVVGGMALLCGLSGRRTKATQYLSELDELSRTASVPPMAFALAYLGLGDDRAFEWLGKAIDARDPIVTHLPSMPLYDSIRDDPRFRALLARMRL